MNQSSPGMEKFIFAILEKVLLGRQNLQKGKFVVATLLPVAHIMYIKGEGITFLYIFIASILYHISQ